MKTPKHTNQKLLPAYTKVHGFRWKMREQKVQKQIAQGMSLQERFEHNTALAERGRERAAVERWQTAIYKIADAATTTPLDGLPDGFDNKRPCNINMKLEGSRLDYHVKMNGSDKWLPVHEPQMIISELLEDFEISQVHNADRAEWIKRYPEDKEIIETDKAAGRDWYGTKMALSVEHELDLVEEGLLDSHEEDPELTDTEAMQETLDEIDNMDTYTPMYYDKKEGGMCYNFKTQRKMTDADKALMKLAAELDYIMASTPEADMIAEAWSMLIAEGMAERQADGSGAESHKLLISVAELIELPAVKQYPGLTLIQWEVSGENKVQCGRKDRQGRYGGKWAGLKVKPGKCCANCDRFESGCCEYHKLTTHAGAYCRNWTLSLSTKLWVTLNKRLDTQSLNTDANKGIKDHYARREYAKRIPKRLCKITKGRCCDNCMQAGSRSGQLIVCVRTVDPAKAQWIAGPNKSKPKFNGQKVYRYAQCEGYQPAVEHADLKQISLRLNKGTDLETTPAKLEADRLSGPDAKRYRKAPVNRTVNKVRKDLNVVKKRH